MTLRELQGWLTSINNDIEVNNANDWYNYHKDDKSSGIRIYKTMPPKDYLESADKYKQFMAGRGFTRQNGFY